MTTRQKFILIVQTAAIVRDIRFNKNISEDIVRCALELPDSLLKRTNYYIAAVEMIDFEYGVLEEDDYSDFVKRYIGWKLKKK